MEITEMLGAGPTHAAMRRVSGDESDGEEEDESAVLCLSESAIKMLMQ